MTDTELTTSGSNEEDDAINMPQKLEVFFAMVSLYRQILINGAQPSVHLHRNTYLHMNNMIIKARFTHEWS